MLVSVSRATPISNWLLAPGVAPGDRVPLTVALLAAALTMPVPVRAAPVLMVSAPEPVAEPAVLLIARVPVLTVVPPE